MCRRADHIRPGKGVGIGVRGKISWWATSRTDAKTNDSDDVSSNYDEEACAAQSVTSKRGNRVNCADRSGSPIDTHVAGVPNPIKAPGPKVVISAAELEGVTTAQRLRGAIYRPEYAHDDDDGLGDFMTHECLNYAARRAVVFVEED